MKKILILFLLSANSLLAQMQWVNPKPVGGDLYSVSFCDATHGAVVGIKGTCANYSGTTWQETTPWNTFQYLKAVCYVDPTHAWAVGGNSAIYRNNGSGWFVEQTLPAMSMGWGMYFSSINDGWFAGWNGFMMHYVNGTWSNVTPFNTLGFCCMHGTGSSNVWAGGNSGTMYRYDGTNWISTNNGLPTNEGIYDVHAFSTTNVWALTDVGGVYHYNGTIWSMVAASNSLLYQGWGISGTSSSNIWISGNDGIFHYNGSTWTHEYSGNDMYDIQMLTNNNGWSVGANGVILHYNGTTWNPLSEITTANLNGMDMLNANDGWIAGDAGTLLHGNGTQWTSVPSGTTNNLNDVDMLDVHHAWAVGNAGTILFYNGSVWSPQNSGTTQNLNSVSFVDANHGWAVGNAGVILKFNGSSWTQQPCANTDDIFGIQMYDTTFGMAVGQRLLVLRYEIGFWTVFQHYTSWVMGDLRDVKIANPNSAYCAGDDFERYNGVLTQDPGYSSYGINSVFPVDSNLFWTVGVNGDLKDCYQYSWSNVEGPTIGHLNDCWFENAGTGWIIGNAGAIIRLNNAWVGVPQISPMENGLSVYPNPFSENFSMDFNLHENGFVRLDIYDAEGRCVKSEQREFSEGEQHWQLDAADFPEGVLMYRLITPEKISSGKLVHHQE